MFEEPCQRPIDSNVLLLIWIYPKKLYSTKKARCLCNGIPRMKGSVSLAHKYAAVL